MAINKKLGAAAGATSIGAMGATGIAAAGQSAALASLNALNGMSLAAAQAATVAAPTGLAGSAGMAAAAPAAAAMAAALPLVMGLTGMPSGKANVAKLKQAKQDKKLGPILKKLEQQRAANLPPGITDEKYAASRVPPANPAEIAQREIMSSGQGDKDYQIDQAEIFNNSEAGRAEFASWRQQGDNALWYNEDRTRTDYAGPYAPSLSEQRAQAEILFGKQEAGEVDPSLDITDDAAATEATGEDDVSIGLPEDPATAGLPEGAKFEYTAQKIADEEFMTEEGKTLGAAAIVDNDELGIIAAKAKDVGMPDVTLVGGAVPILEDIDATLVDNMFIGDVEGSISDAYIAQEAANKDMLKNFEVFKGSTVKEQLAMLQDDWSGEGGEPKVPFYAQGVVTAARQEMAARGMGGSSMASAAITQAGLTAMIPVAMADAQFFQSLTVKSFDFQTSMGLTKLAHIGDLDKANLSYRQTQAVDTAKKFFDVEMFNVEGARVTAATNMATKVQALFSDQAAENVASNLGFTTQVESDQFYDQLALQAAEASKRMLLDANKFNASVINSRAEFNSSMAFEIERGNLDYLRSVNTATTAGINQANMTNSQNILGISNTAIANALTLQRDDLHRIFEASENAADRAANYAVASLNADSAMNRLSVEQNNENSNNIGAFLSDIGTTLINGFMEDRKTNKKTTPAKKNATNPFDSVSV